MIKKRRLRTSRSQVLTILTAISTLDYSLLVSLPFPLSLLTGYRCVQSAVKESTKKSYMARKKTNEVANDGILEPIVSTPIKPKIVIVTDCAHCLEMVEPYEAPPDSGIMFMCPSCGQSISKYC